MTEEEWLACDDPQQMLEFLRSKVSERKLRLLAVAACRRLLHLVADDRTRAAVMVAEDFADGNAEERARVRAEAKARTALEEADSGYDNRLYDGSHPEGDEGVARGWSLLAHRDLAAAGCWALQPTAFAAADHALQAANSAERGAVQASVWAGRKGQSQADELVWDENRPQAELLRCIIGSPFRPVATDPRWLTSTVRDLARTIYEDRAFDRLPILADALEDAGCDNVDILAHCRGDGPHVRGCWVVDLILGKS